MTIQKQRIWELDAARGLCLLGMIVVHFFYDLSHFGGVSLQFPQWCYFLKDYGHILFVLISGICVTLACHSFKRGILVLVGGLFISYVTLFLDEVVGIKDVRIWFGILHMLGLCMMIYPLFKKFPGWALAAVGACMILLGYWLDHVTVSVDFLFPLGLCSDNIFIGSDYAPLFPGLGWFLMGAALGKTVYRRQQSLLPKINSQNTVLHFLQDCGKHSLMIYLLHQPILLAVVWLTALF